jgi:hypothetical protein
VRTSSAKQQTKENQMKAKAEITSKPQTTSAKQITLETLRELKAKMYAQADAAIRASDPRNPQKIMRIQRRVDRDARHIAFAINAVTFKM